MQRDSSQVVPRRVEARFWATADWDTANCQLCPHLCSIAPSRTGSCGVRSNRNGILYCDNYGKPAIVQRTEAADLPLYHFKPRSDWLLVGMKGCNMRCPFCNTYQFSQIGGVQTSARTPENIVRETLEGGMAGVAFGVNEPLVSHEFVVDVFHQCRAAGVNTFLASAGAWNEEAFEEILECTDAITFGFKGFDEMFLTNECGGHLDVIQHNLQAALSRNLHVETSYLVIQSHPGWREQADAFADWLSSLDTSVPVIVLRLEKAFSWREESTSVPCVREVRDRLAEKLDFVYLHEKDQGLMDTPCPECGRILVRRGLAGTVPAAGLERKDSCPSCGAPLPFTV